MRRSRLVIQPAHVPTTAGGPMYGEVQVWQRPDANLHITRNADGQARSIITSLPPEEVIDYPEYTRDQLGREIPLGRFKRAQVMAVYGRVASTYGLGMTLPIMNLPPDTQPVAPTQRLWEIPFERVKARHTAAAFAALLAAPSAPSYFPAFIPASTYSVAMCRLMEEIQFHMLETADEGVTWNSGLWTQGEVVHLINERISRFLVETGVTQARVLIAVAAGALSVDLPADWIEIRRVAWNGVELPRVSLTELEATMPDWEDVGATAPDRYMEVPTPSLNVRLARFPTVAGTLDVIGVREPAAMTASCASLLPLPDEWTPYIKYGVMADMLSKEGEANDPQRAQLCEARWGEGVALARVFLGTEGL